MAASAAERSTKPSADTLTEQPPAHVHHSPYGFFLLLSGAPPAKVLLDPALPEHCWAGLFDDGPPSEHLLGRGSAHFPQHLAVHGLTKVVGMAFMRECSSLVEVDLGPLAGTVREVYPGFLAECSSLVDLDFDPVRAAIVR